MSKKDIVLQKHNTIEGIDIDKALKLVRKLQRCEDISGETWLLMTLNKEATDADMV